MKWSLQQLLKIQKFPYHFNYVEDLSDDLKQVYDIYDAKPVNITGCINRIDDDTYRFVYDVKTTLILQCALTLDPIEFEFQGSYDEIYSTIPSDDYYLIEKNTINLSEMVISNIITDKPINVSKPDAYDILKSRGIELDETLDEEDDEIISYSDGFIDNDEQD